MEQTTKAEFIAELKSSLVLTPSNTAIQKHLAKVEAMTEEQFQEHNTRLNALKAKFKPAVNRMVLEVQRQTKRSYR